MCYKFQTGTGGDHSIYPSLGGPGARGTAMITVSIVDDEKELCQSIATFVNGAPGFRCVSMYHSAEAALKHLPQDRPDVVLMDIHLTGMSGIECVERLKAMSAGTADHDVDGLRGHRPDFQGVVGRSQRVYVETADAEPSCWRPFAKCMGAGRRCRVRLRAKSWRPFKSRDKADEEKTHLSPREQMVLELHGQGPYLQTNRRPVGHQH